MRQPLRLPRRQAFTETPQDAQFAMQVQYAKGMMGLSAEDGIGVALSYLLMAANQEPHRTMLRVCLNEQVVREGFRGEALITTLKRLAT